MLPKELPFSKRWVMTLVLALIVLLVGVGAFGLGRLSALREQKGSLNIYAPVQAAAAAEATRALAVPAQAPTVPAVDTHAVHNYVASKNGTKYYAASCSGASRIKLENQVWFATAAAAESAGYELAANCSGVR